MRNFVSFEWEIGNREHLTRDFFFSSKMPQDLLEAMPTFSIINPLYFYSRNSWISPMTFLMLASIAKGFFFEKAICFKLLNYSSNIAWNWKKTVFFLCCSNDVELNMSIVKFEFEFTRLSAFTMTWQSSFLPWH